MRLKAKATRLKTKVSNRQCHSVLDVLAEAGETEDLRTLKRLEMDLLEVQDFLDEILMAIEFERRNKREKVGMVDDGVFVPNEFLTALPG